MKINSIQKFDSLYSSNAMDQKVDELWIPKHRFLNWNIFRLIKYSSIFYRSNKEKLYEGKTNVDMFSFDNMENKLSHWYTEYMSDMNIGPKNYNDIPSLIKPVPCNLRVILSVIHIVNN